ncbi:MAG: glycosyltransferase family 2 protein [bacterium]
MSSFISVIIPLFNKENTISSCIESILQQQHENFEIIIVNDGSTDASLEKAKSFTDTRIHIHTTKNHGVSAARNFGVSKANSEYICFLDADDTWRSNHLKDLYALLENFPDCGMYGKAYAKDYGQTIRTNHLDSLAENWQGIVSNYFELACKFSVATSSSVLIPKATFEELGGFNKHVNAGEDTELWIKIALNFPVAFHNSISVDINMHAGNKATLKNSTKKNYFNIDSFDSVALSNISLEKYLQLNRYTRALKFKQENNITLFNEVFAKIKLKHLNLLQKVLLQSPKWLTDFTFAVHQKGIKKGLFLTTFK